MPITDIINTGDLVPASYLNAITAFLNAIEAGSKVLTKVTIDGASSDPAVSPSGDAVVYYNVTDDELRVSQNGSAYERVGSRPYADPVLIGGTVFGFRY
jgi:hypothetical protein